MKVTAYTSAGDSSAAQGTHYDPIGDQVLAFADGETEKEVELVTQPLVGADSSKVVTLQLKDATNGAEVHPTRSTAHVTIADSAATKALLDDVKTRLCTPAGSPAAGHRSASSTRCSTVRPQTWDKCPADKCRGPWTSVPCPHPPAQPGPAR